MRHILLLPAFLLFAPSVALSQSTAAYPAATGADTARFADEIAEFLKSDRLNPPRAGGVVFVGSSSIRMWPHLAADFPGENVIQRGFGGSELSDVVYRAPQIVIPYKPRLIVLYAGDNDLAAGRTPEEILSRFESFVSLIHDTLPRTGIVFVSIKPSWSRVSLLDKMKQANDLVRHYIAGRRGLGYVDVFTPMLGADGKPRMDLLVADSLHMNEMGYSIWRRRLMPIVTSPAQSR
ncbi:MAG TPA: SGNH/GDSL hydrolase family protein [Gemmatimonadaceae bacterium]|jgi:lysophospholipase L1-like esterase